MTTAATERATRLLESFDPVSVAGEVLAVSTLGIEVSDRLGALDIGARVHIDRPQGPLVAETVGVSAGAARLMPFGPTAGVRRGARAAFLSGRPTIFPSQAWLGRVVDGLGAPIDGKGPLLCGDRPMPLRARPPLATERARLGPRIDFGVRALNAFATAREGQRLGLFSGSGVGKSQLLSMIARYTACDVAVVALIGERGREVREFIEDNLGAAGLARTVVVVSTSDEPAMMRREAAFVALAVAEYFRDAGARVLCLMDSITRVAAAQREIGLASGEPPTAKGYTPSVFSLLPSLLERAGPGREGAGAITGVFSVLVEGDDHDEPVADAARAVLDGHVVLDRRIAERGRFPAIDILKTVSRAMPGAADPAEGALIAEARRLASLYEDMREMIRIGAYQRGANPEVDRAVLVHERLERFLNQDRAERCAMSETFAALAAALA